MTQRQTLSILFYLRNDKAKNEKQVPVYMRITVNGKRAEMSIHRSIDPAKWNKSGGFVKGTKQETKKLNEFIDLQRSKVYAAQRDLIEENKPVTAIALKNRTQGIAEDQKSLLELFTYHNSQMREMVPTEYSPSTMKRYVTTMDHIKAFINYHYKVDDMFLSELDHNFITQLYHYFRTNRKTNHNTAIKYIKNLKKVINIAVQNDWLRKDPFGKYSVKLRPVKRDFLTQEELQEIEDLEIKIERLDQVRDIFVFSCYTGLAYTDVAKLSTDNIRKGIDGNMWIFTEREKTSTKSNIPLLAKAREIIDKYKESPKSDKNQLLPVLSNQKMNAYLKEIGTLANINKNLTFHLARHTFATLMLTHGMSIETVSDLLGHKSIRTTQIYAKVVERKKSEEMIKIEEKLSKTNHKKKKQV